MIAGSKSKIVLCFLQPHFPTDRTTNLVTIICMAVFYTIFGLPDFHVFNMHINIDKPIGFNCYRFRPISVSE